MKILYVVNDTVHVHIEKDAKSMIKFLTACDLGNYSQLVLQVTGLRELGCESPESAIDCIKALDEFKATKVILEKEEKLPYHTTEDWEEVITSVVEDKDKEHANEILSYIWDDRVSEDKMCCSAVNAYKEYLEDC